MDREDEVSKITERNGFKFLKQVESKTNQFEIVVKSLASFSTQFRVKLVVTIG